MVQNRRGAIQWDKTTKWRASNEKLIWKAIRFELRANNANFGERSLRETGQLGNLSTDLFHAKLRAHGLPGATLSAGWDLMLTAFREGQIALHAEH